jgi:FkbM family methyltransferase
MDMRTRARRALRQLFASRVLEQMLSKTLERYPEARLARKLVPENSWFPPGSWRTVTRHGLRFKLDINDYEDWLLYFHSAVDASLGMIDRLADSTLILDVGANIGQTSLVISHRARRPLRIIAFEPYPETFRKFFDNLALNPGITNITAEPLGLGAQEASTMMFKDCVTNSGGNRMVYDRSDNTAGLAEVRVTTLDRYMETHSPGKVDFLKIDVEGYEYAVLKGAEKVLIEHRPKLFIELDDDNLRKQGASASTVTHLLRDHGYRVVDDHTGRELTADRGVTGHRDIYCEPR